MYTKYDQWLNEAKSKTGRAWNNKLERIEEFIDYLESNNLLGKRELAKKHSLFNAYYRWYNDGDFPKFLTQYGVYRGMSKTVISDKLEELVTNFITDILSKYLSKVDRINVRTSVYVAEIDTSPRRSTTCRVSSAVPSASHCSGRCSPRATGRPLGRRSLASPTSWPTPPVRASVQRSPWQPTRAIRAPPSSTPPNTPSSTAGSSRCGSESAWPRWPSSSSSSAAPCAPPPATSTPNSTS